MFLKKILKMRILILILPILFFFHLFLQTNFFPYQYVYTEWLISYEGGFVKRGLGGQIILEITKIFKLKLEYVDKKGVERVAAALPQTEEEPIKECKTC